MGDDLGAIDALLGPLLLPPLWTVTVRGFLDPVDRWYFGRLKTFQPRGSADAGASDAQKTHELLKMVVELNYLHVLEPLYEHAVGVCGALWHFDQDLILEVIRLDRAQMLEFVHTRDSFATTMFYCCYVDDDSRPGFDFIIREYPYYEWRCSNCVITQGHISAICGSINVLEVEQRRDIRLWDSVTASLLVRHGHIDALQRICGGDIKCPIDAWTYAAALEADNVALVRWLDEHGANSDGGVCAGANISSVEMLQYLMERGRIPYNPEDLMQHVASSGPVEMLKYLIEKTSVMEDVRRSDVVRWACADGLSDTSKLEYLFGRGFAMPYEGHGMDPGIRSWFEASGHKYRDRRP